MTTQQTSKLVKTVINWSFILLVCLFSLTFSPDPSFAQSSEDDQPLGLKIQPSIAVIEVVAGETVRGRIGIGKTIPDPIPIFSEVAKYSPPDTDFSIYDKDLWDASQWITLEQKPIIITGEEIQYMEFQTDVPIDVKPGTYFATILFQPVMPPSFFLPESARVIPYIGSLLVVNVLGDETSKIPPKIVEFRYIDSNREDKQYFDASLSNDDDFYQELSGVVAIRSVLGKEIAEIKVPKTRLLPGETEALQLIASTRIKPGLYNAQMDLISDRGINTKSIFFFSIGDSIDPAVMFISLVAILTSLSILISRHTISRRTKRRGHKKIRHITS